ncbi:hypothetical protein JW905_14480 [bacterium]|nr:hypothetical protein [candidate division CSSED10-310 bacterium]
MVTKKVGSTLMLVAALILVGGAVMADDPIVTTVCDIQAYNGIVQGDRVQVTGVCTAETGRYGSQNTVIADVDNGGTPYCCGLWVYVVDADLIALQGECVTVVGIVQEYYGKTELFVGSEETVRPDAFGCGSPLPAPIVVSTADGSKEEYECCLLETECVTVTEEPDDFGVFLFQDDKTPAGEMMGLFALAWEPPVVGDFYCTMRGILDYAWDTFRLRPRNQDDDLDDTPQASCSSCGGGPGPTPTPTPNPCSDPVVVDLMLNKEQPSCFMSGDLFSLTVAAQNPCPSTRTVDAYCVLDVYGQYFFWDGTLWPEAMSYYRVDLPASAAWNTTILEFFWPAGAGAANDLFFYFAMMDRATLDLASNVDVVTFCFQ